MNKTAWIKEKSKFLSDYFSKKNDGNIKTIIEEKLSPAENKTIAKNASWNELLEASRKLNPTLAFSSLDTSKSGFHASDSLSQNIIDCAFDKKVNEIFDELDVDYSERETIREYVLDHIVSNRLYNKKFNELIKKIKNLDTYSLPISN
jgi:hypothetical protein